jgi:hypothetical protein
VEVWATLRHECIAWGVSLQHMAETLWKTIKGWIDAFSFAFTVAALVVALGGGVAITLLANLWAHVTGAWLFVECCGWVGLMSSSFLLLKQRDERKRAIEITGVFLYAQLNGTNRIFVKVSLEAQPGLKKNIKGFALFLGDEGQFQNGQRVPIGAWTFVTKLPDGIHSWRTHAEQETLHDIETTLANSDALILSGECSGWMQFCFPAASLKSGDTISLLLTITEESGYQFKVRDKLVALH